MTERGYIMFRKEEKSGGVLRAVLITAGIIVFVFAAVAVIYKFFKKHFRITLECGDYDFCDDDCFCEEEDFEPECCVYDGSCCCDSALADDIADEIADGLSEAE